MSRPHTFQRPEHALLRAQEYLETGERERALDTLYEFIRHRRYRTWQKVYEQIIELIINLGVELRKSQIIKDSLYQYKMICMQVNTGSLQAMVHKYLAMANEKAALARSKSKEALQDVEDLEILATPEDLLLSAVARVDSVERKNRQLLAPWISFLWEAHRTCLELLKNNKNFEELYHEIAKKSFAFCREFERRNELRKLCDTLRNHLQQILKNYSSTYQFAIKLTDDASLKLHLETRHEQLSTAQQMDAWQQAFLAIEDISNVTQYAKKQVKGSQKANYLKCCAQVLWKSNEYLFHAAARQVILQLTKDLKKNVTEEELRHLANIVVCSVLVVPLRRPDHKLDQLISTEQDKLVPTLAEKYTSLATLLDINAIPSRDQLLIDLRRRQILQLASPQLQLLHQSLETDFNPLAMGEIVAGATALLETAPDLAVFIEPLQNICTQRSLQQLSEVYDTIRMEAIAAAIPFVPADDLELTVIRAARFLGLSLRYDDVSRSIKFKHAAVQQDGISELLSRVTEALDESVAHVDEKREDNLAQKFASAHRRDLSHEVECALEKRQMSVQKRAEVSENELKAKERVRLERRQLIHKGEVEQHKKQREEDEKRQEEIKIAKNMENKAVIESRKKDEFIEMTRANFAVYNISFDLGTSCIASMSFDELQRWAQDKLTRATREKSERLKVIERRLDYFVRTKRIYEIPSVQERFVAFMETDASRWEAVQKEQVQAAETKYNDQVTLRDRLEHIQEDEQLYMKTIEAGRRKEYEKQVAEFQATVEKERIARWHEMREERKREKRAEWLRKKAETEKQAEMELEARQREMDERRRAQQAPTQRYAPGPKRPGGSRFDALGDGGPAPPSRFSGIGGDEDMPARGPGGMSALRRPGGPPNDRDDAPPNITGPNRDDFFRSGREAPAGGGRFSALGDASSAPPPRPSGGTWGNRERDDAPPPRRVGAGPGSQFPALGSRPADAWR